MLLNTFSRCQITCKLLKSKTKAAYEDMRATPISLPTMNAYEFMDNIYKQHVMEAVNSCSNLPQFKGKWNNKDMSGDYTMKGCSIKANEKLFASGYYYLLLVEVKRTVAPKLDFHIRIYAQAK